MREVFLFANRNMSKISNKERTIAISWLLYSIRVVMGMEEVRKKIIIAGYPKIKNKRLIRTFDAFQQYETPPFTDKKEEIIAYCKQISVCKKPVVFTASNIQTDVEDEETHYQTFIVNNQQKIVYVINPSWDKNAPNQYGIYEPEIAYRVIQPFFENLRYDVKYIELSNPAQETTEDVFCQTWSLMILLDILNRGPRVVVVPKLQSEKYKLLLSFYQNVFQEIPMAAAELNDVYAKTVRENARIIREEGGIDSKHIDSICAMDLLFSMTPKEMI